MINLSNKTILITGASSGIGRACAVLCSQLGARVALVGRNEERLFATLNELTGSGHALFVQDLTQSGAIDHLLESVGRQFPEIHGVVHAAGIQMTRPLNVMNEARYAEIYNINVIAAFELVRLLVKRKLFSDSGASAVFLSSVAGLRGRKGLVGYSSSKGALVSGTRVLGLELAARKIRVNCISPGLVQTAMKDETLRLLSAAQIEQRLADYPLGVGAPEDVASATAFLLSDAARWITGTNLIVDGGYSCG